MGIPCTTCGYSRDAKDATHCGLCGVLRRPASALDRPPASVSPKAPSPDSASPNPASPGSVSPASVSPVPARTWAQPGPAPIEVALPRALGRRGRPVAIGWRYLIIGMVLALAFTLTPTLRFMGWFIGSLFHETGHVAYSWFVGCPAWPAISLRGHAAAFHQPQNPVVVALIGLGLVTGIVIARQQQRFGALAIGLLVLWPLLTFFEGIREVGFLLSGHLGELVFAGVFLWRARTGEAIEHEAERPLYACVGWFLLVRNIVLTAGLTFTESARALYMTNGSFGLTNDYVRVAQHWLHVPLQAVSGFMLLVALGTFPLVLALTGSPAEDEKGRPSVLKPEASPLAYSPPPEAPSPPPRRVLPRSRVRH